MADRGYEQKHAADDADDVTLDLPIDQLVSIEKSSVTS